MTRIAAAIGLVVALAPAFAACSKTPSAPLAAATSGAAPATAVAAPLMPKAAPPVCPAATTDVTIVASPAQPWKGAPVRVMVVADAAMDGRVVLRDPSGAEAASSDAQHGGPPYWWYAEIPAAAEGSYEVELVNPCGRDLKRSVIVSAEPPPQPRATWGTVWPIHEAWNRSMENLYSAWIEKLFDAPLDQQPTWNALHEVLRDAGRNFLFDHLGAKEDELGYVIRPDCADLPFFLRAYFAFKMGLPFGYSKCSRGGAGQPPSCVDWSTNQDASAAQRPGVVASFAHFVRYTLADGVHSGTGRAPANDDATDYYSVALTAQSLRPGTVYADPYGHVLVLAKRIPQTPDAGGMFLAVDGQPDGTVARKRFWRGNFLFSLDPANGSPGFKRFRPIVKDASGKLHRLTNAEIAKDPDYADFSLDEYAHGVDGFYDAMDDVMSPEPLDPVRALEEIVDALEEQVKTRVQSVDNGRKFAATGKTAEMPDGPAIFETTGSWEDFSTPSRDLRLLIAIDVARGFPDHVAHRPERYAMPAGKTPAEVKAQLDALLAEELSKRTFVYQRTDESNWKLALQDVIDRMPSFEMTYNPNDCVELRWGAPDGPTGPSDEMSTCKRHAPPAQTAKMRQYRAWFHTRTRPPRP
jgi:hypothetical protein